MDEENIALLQSISLLAGLVIACYAIAMRANLSSLWRLILAAILPPFLFQGIGFMHLGYLDKFFLIALVITFPICIGLSFLAHILFKSFMKNQ